MSRARSQQLGHLVGITVVLCCLAYFFVYDPNSKLELICYDLRVRDFSRIPAKSDIVHIDIDDNSLDRVHRWPWSRDELADLVRVIDELKPGHVLIDFLLSEYEPPPRRDVRYGPDSDIQPNVQTIGDLSDEDVVFGDLELADALRKTGRVFLAAQVDLQSAGRRTDIAHRLDAVFEKDKRITLPQAIGALDLSDAPELIPFVNRELVRLRVRDALLRDFAAGEARLASQLNLAPPQIADVFAGVKKGVAETLSAKFFNSGNAPPLSEVLQGVLGDKADRQNEDQNDVKNAYRYLLGLAIAEKHLIPLPNGGDFSIPLSTRMTPPHFLLGEAAKGIGAVNFVADRDGIVRRVPLLIRIGNKAALHLGFAAACHIMGLNPNQVQLQGNMMILQGKEDLRVPLDENGNMLIPWTSDARREDRQGGFRHISAAKLWSIVAARREMEQNQKAINYAMADLVALSKGEIKVESGNGQGGQRIAADNPFREVVNKWVGLRHRAHQARIRRNASEAEIAGLDEQARQLEAQINKEHETAAAAIERFCRDIDSVTPEEMAKDPELQADAKKYHAARDVIKKQIPALREANTRLMAKVEQTRIELADLQGKHIVLGFAATATGDIVSTPINPITNGPVCHAQILNGFLQNEFYSLMPRPLEVGICLVLGIAIVWITMTRVPSLALGSTLLLMAAYTVVNCIVLFRMNSIVATLAAPVVTMFVSWAFVTLFRQLTAERDRRLFVKQLGQYTSPLLAAKIAESPAAAAAFKTVQTRNVTCFFSDLAGFTTISEKEDAEVVQFVLNTYLKRMSEAIWSKRGLINKFMGDGIMAFFNPSVDPLPEHPLAACETSLLVLNELEKLKSEQRDGPASRVFEQLHMRVGLASGPAKNGDLGSELKADYTVIGDVVNLAARLEPANKVFGTNIMISGPTFEKVKDDFDFRYLAELQVKGKESTVPVYELVAPKGQMTPEQREYADRFAAGVELYKKGEWDQCIVHFTRMLAKRFDDPGASRYIDACQELKQFPPENGWAGALELKEK